MHVHVSCPQGIKNHSREMKPHLIGSMALIKVLVL